MAKTIPRVAQQISLVVLIVLAEGCLHQYLDYRVECVVVGKVIDQRGSEPIPKATVALFELGAPETFTAIGHTNLDGHFSINIIQTWGVKRTVPDYRSPASIPECGLIVIKDGYLPSNQVVNFKDDYQGRAAKSDIGVIMLAPYEKGICGKHGAKNGET